MSLVLVRVDDRLIHGQVTQGWAGSLKPDRLVLVNDTVAQSRWERELYEASAPEGIRVSVLGMDEASGAIEGWLTEGEDLLVLVDGPKDALCLREAGVAFDYLNVGGLHYREGRTKVLPYVCVDDADVRAFKLLQEQGVEIECADVPGCERKDLFECLGSVANGT